MKVEGSLMVEPAKGGEVLFNVRHHLFVVSKVNTRTLHVGGAGELSS